MSAIPRISAKSAVLGVALLLGAMSSGAPAHGQTGDADLVFDIVGAPLRMAMGGDPAVVLIETLTGGEIVGLDPATGETRIRMESTRFAIGPGGRLAAFTDSRGRVSLIGLDDLSVAMELNARLEVSAFGFSDDGTLMLTGDDTGAVRLWDLASGEQVQTFFDMEERVSKLLVNLEGSVVVAGGRHGQVKAWDVASGDLLFETDIPGYYGLAAGAGGRLFMASERWDTAHVVDLAQPSAAPQAIALDKDDYAFAELVADGAWLVLKHGRKGLGVVDVAAGTLAYALGGGRPQSITAYAVSRDGTTIATGGESGDVRLYDLATGTLLDILDVHDTKVAGLAFTADGTRLVSVSPDRTLRVTAVPTEPMAVPPTGPDRCYDTGFARGVVYAPDGASIVGAPYRGTRRWLKAATGEPGPSFADGDDRVLATAFDLDGDHMVTAMQSGAMHIWSLASGERVQSLSGHPVGIETLEIGGNGTWILSLGWNGQIALWDVEAGTHTGVFGGEEEPVASIALSADGMTGVLASDQRMVTVDIVAGSFTHLLWDGSGDAAIGHVALHADDRLILSVDVANDTTSIWDASTGALLQAIASDQGNRFAPVVDHAGTAVLLNEGRDALLYELASGALRHRLAHSNTVHTVAFSPDDTLVLTASADGTARIWDTRSGAQLRRLDGGHHGIVEEAVFRPDGREVMTTGTDKQTCFWPLDLPLALPGSTDE